MHLFSEETKYILIRCGLEPIDQGLETWGRYTAEVITSHGKISINRAFRRYYWVAKGPVPLNIAKELYDHPVGRTDIRVTGHCACPPPKEPWITWVTSSGQEVIFDPDGKQAEEWDKFNSKFPLGPKPIFSSIPDLIHGAEPYIMNYHIDSELGLYIFVSTLRSKE